MTRYILVGLGGMLGAMARYALSGWVSGATAGRFPYGTLVVNLIGSFVIGFFLVLALERFSWNPDLRIFFTVGFLGAFTTFSTFSYETMALLQAGDYRRAGGYALASVVVSLLAMFAGFELARVLIAARRTA